MQNLFADPNVDQSGPFSEVETTTTAEAPLDSVASIRQSRVMAAASVDPNVDRVLSHYRELQSLYEDGIKSSNEFQQRLEISTAEVQRRQGVLREMSQADYRTDPTGELQRGAYLALQQERSDAAEREANIAAERAAAQRLVDIAGSDPDQARILQYLYDRGNVVDQAIDYTTKSLIVARGIERAQGAVQDQGWIRHVADFGLSMLPLKASMGNTGNVATTEYDNFLKNMFSQVFSGGRTRAEAANLWALNAEDFAAYYENQYLPNVLNNATLLGYTNRSQQLEILSQLQQTKSATEINAWNLLDNAGIVGSVATVGGKMALKSTSSLATNALRLGGRKTAANMYAHAAEVAAKDLTPEALNRVGVNSLDEVVDSLATSSIRQGIQPPHAVSPQAIANNILDEARGLVDKLPEWLQPGRFADQAEFEKALNDFVEKESQRFDSRIADTRPVTIKTADGSSVTAVDFVLGRKDGSGFVRESSANNYAKGLGFGDAQVVPAEDGSFFVQIRRTMPENGVYVNDFNVQTRGPIARFLAGARRRSDPNLANAATRSDMARNRIINKVIPDLAKDLRVDPMSRQRLTTLWKAGDNEGVWWTRDEANILYQRTFNRDISEKEWKTYNALRKINDVEYAIRNDMVWKEKAIKGVETVSADLGPIAAIHRANAIVDEGMTRAMTGRIVKADDGTAWSGKIPDEEMAALREQGYIAVHLEDTQKNFIDSSEFGVVLIKPENLQRFSLDPKQLPYRPGGHRFYEEEYFAKQARFGQNPDGSKYLKSPSTFIVGTKAEVDEWTGFMERMRLAVKNDPKISAGALDDIIDGRPGYPTGEEFLAGIKDGTYDVNQTFKTYFDREMPAEYHQSPNPFVDMEESGFSSYMRTTGRMYYSKKGSEALRDFRGERAITLDPWKATNRSMINIANMSSFSDYKIQAVQRWYNAFNRYLEPNPALNTPMQHFMHGKLNKLATQDNVAHAIEDQRTIVRRNLGWKTDFDLRAQEFQRRAAEWVMGSDPDSIRHGASRAIINFMEDKNPIAFLRGWAFDLKLGMLNPSQLFLQANTYFAIQAIDPAGAARGLQTVLPLRAFLSFKGDKEAMLRTLGKSAKNFGFDDAEEMSEFFRAAERSGFFDINESHTLINSMGPSSSFNVTGNKLNDLRQAGRFFFNEGELFNRAVAFRSAWRSEWAKGADKANLSDPFVMNGIIGRAEDLAMGMSRSSQAWWQQGLASIPTQFWSYQVRMMEGMLGGFTGKGPFTRAEAWRLMAYQMFLYGSAGIPMAGVISDVMSDKTGSVPELNTVGGFIDRGFLDTLWYNVTGGSDVLISERLGTGGWLADTVGDLFGMGRYGDVTPMDVLGGATWSISKDVWDDIGPVLKYASAESGADQGQPFTERALTSLAKNITSVSNVLKAQMIMEYGYLKSNSGNTQFSDLPDATAVALLMLGAQPGQQKDLEAMSAFNRNRTEKVKEAAKVVSQYRQEMLNHPERVDELAEEINLFMNMFDNETRREILNNVYKTQDKSLYDSYARRRNERQQREAFMEGSN